MFSLFTGTLNISQNLMLHPLYKFYVIMNDLFDTNWCTDISTSKNHQSYIRSNYGSLDEKQCTIYKFVLTLGAKSILRCDVKSAKGVNS